MTEIDAVDPNSKKKWGQTQLATPPAKWTRASVPWNWREITPGDLWSSLMKHLLASQVIDLTPGPTLSTTCLKDNLPYMGIAKTAAYKDWLLDTIDQATLNLENPMITQNVIDGHWAPWP